MAKTFGYSQAFLDAEYERSRAPELPEWVVCLSCGKLDTDPTQAQCDAANDAREDEEGERVTQAKCGYCGAVTGFRWADAEDVENHYAD